MWRAVVLACWPWALVLCGAVLLVVLLIRASGAAHRGGDWRRLWALPADDRGAVQSLSFVLTLPLFVLLMLFIVQVSQIMIGTVIVHYAAFAAARAASVWIPARVGDQELENCIGAGYYPDPFAPDQVVPITDPTDPQYGPTAGGMTFIVPYDPASPKWQKIVAAAVYALMPICPSRDVGLTLPPSSARAVQLVQQAYSANVPTASMVPRVPRRLENKLAYALAATELELRFFHSNHEPPLMPYFLEDDVYQFRPNELGFQDTITVTLTHHMALLPGPGKFLARAVRRPDGLPDKVAQEIEIRHGIATYPLRASITLGHEGEKSVIPYRYWLSGMF